MRRCSFASGQELGPGCGRFLRALSWAPHPRVRRAAHLPQKGTPLCWEERENSQAPRILVQSGSVGRGAGDFTFFFCGSREGRMLEPQKRIVSKSGGWKLKAQCQPGWFLFQASSSACS